MTGKKGEQFRDPSAHKQTFKEARGGAVRLSPGMVLARCG